MGTSQPSPAQAGPAQAGPAQAGPATGSADEHLDGPAPAQPATPAALGPGLPTALVAGILAGATGAPGAFQLIGIEGLQERYGIGRTTAYRLVAQPGFPARAPGGRDWRAPLASVLAWELAVSLGPTLAALAATAPSPVPAPRPARRGRPRKDASGPGARP
jgi:predicted DNA-binding transcriptional regulator AlpA